MKTYHIIQFIILVFTIQTPQLLSADTIPDSTQIYGVWDIEGSPYTIMGLATIPVDSTLTIDPGVRVEFKSSTNDSAFIIQYIDVGFIKAYGNIVAIGTETDSITFAPSGEGRWGTVNFFDVIETSSFKYCNVTLSRSIGDEQIPGENYIGGLGFFNSPATVENSRISNNCFGIYCSGSEFIINNNDIIDNYWNGIGIFESSGCINNNFIYQNNEIGISTHTSTTLIANNLIEGQLKGISSYESNDTISNNTIRYNSWGGITITRNNSVVSNNVIYGGNSGIRCNGQPRIINNTIVYNNYSGIYCDYHAKPIIINSIIFGNQDLIFYDLYDTVVFVNCLLQVDSLDPGLIDAGDNIFNEDPLFNDPYIHDFSLMAGSPCINSGTAYFEWNSEVLLNLSPEQYYGSAPDIGAIESNITYIPEKYNNRTQSINVAVYPNPTNGIINFQNLNPDFQFDFELRNIQGQLVKKENVIQSSDCTTNIADLQAGVYFYMIKEKGVIVQQGKLIKK